MHSYPYFDAQNSSLRFDEMIAALQQRGPGDVQYCSTPAVITPVVSALTPNNGR